MILLISIPIFAQDSEIPCSEDPNCEEIDGTTVYSDYTGPDDTMYWNPGNGGNSNDDTFGEGEGTGGGTGTDSNEEMSEEKEEYCDQLDSLQGLLSGLLSGNNITGSAATGYSIAQGSVGIFNDILQAAYHDIGFYYETGGTSYATSSYTDGLINWYDAYIDWPLGSFNYSKESQPSASNGGLQHIFTTWVQSVGQGNGTSVLTDPEPGTECP